MSLGRTERTQPALRTVGRCAVRASGQLMMRRPSVQRQDDDQQMQRASTGRIFRCQQRASAGADLSGINRRTKGLALAPADRRPPSPHRSTCARWMFAHVQSVYDQPTGHLYTQMIRPNPRRSRATIYHINYVGARAAIFLRASFLGFLAAASARLTPSVPGAGLKSRWTTDRRADRKSANDRQTALRGHWRPSDRTSADDATCMHAAALI